MSNIPKGYKQTEAGVIPLEKLITKKRNVKQGAIQELLNRKILLA